MEFLSILFDSSVLMTVIAFIFAVFGFKCLIYGVAGGTSTLLRIILTIVFAGLAYFCWRHAMSVHGSNIIDRFVFDSWAELKHLISGLKIKF